ncbi:hypothetical protein AMJ87_04385 [candidate division WOR_3 bacterium SM23_60]|uniref:Uncharacterized protein n=1 Tax=candidate division WOR_3 bacterium SM23_60 TaxID=1703780 RepID=A0A0S8GJQ1_UNCW3|nr:MAG: hypothetical protein AMJ87_04385 [candidate division WOR_3 bacterium SM23_60]
MQRTFPLVLVFVFGILGILPFIIPHPVVQNTNDFLLNVFLKILLAFALVLGLGSLLKVHMDKIKRKRENWQYSWVLIGTFIVTSIIGLFGGVDGSGILPTHIGSFSFDIWTIYNNVEVPLGATMFALLAFFMASAAYRAFRARSFEATLLLISAFIVMIGVLPLGNRISPYIPSFAQWIMDVPNVAGQRGIQFGVALGAMATALKIILGIERSWLGGGGS